MLLSQVDVFAGGMIVYQAWKLEGSSKNGVLAAVLDLTTVGKRNVLMDQLSKEDDMPARLKDMLR
jgi:hypothetical protein